MNEEQKNGWAIWVILPVCVLATVLVTRWLIKSNLGAPVAQTEEYNADERPVPNEGDTAYTGPETEEPRVKYAPDTVKTKPVAASVRTVEAPGTVAVNSPSVKKQWSFGRARDAISNYVAKSINNPKAVSALLNNQYVVAGFMSRASVKTATANPKALANYLKNPANLSNFMNKAAVRNGMNNGDLVNVFASSKLVGAMLDTPGGVGLMDDPKALGEIFRANPGLASLLSNQNIINALARNPRTADLMDKLPVGGF